jgi:MerR family transcriptional regulator, light-induced transcriptional regulator
MTGLSVDTLRAWERRYQVVKPNRTPRGRLYEDADVERLLKLRNLVGRGFAIGAVAAFADKNLQELLDQAREAVTAAPADQVKDAPLQSILEAVEAFDSTRVHDELGRLAAILSPAEFVYQVALPLMRTVGDRWHAGTLQAAQEHLATEGVRNLLGAMLRLNRPADGQPKLLATTPSGELHELGVLAGAVLAGVRGFQVACLGPNLPADEILFAVERFSPQILLMGIVTPEPAPVTIETVRRVADSLPSDVELWLGGLGALIALNTFHRPGSIFFDDLQAVERTLAERMVERIL